MPAMSDWDDEYAGEEYADEDLSETIPCPNCGADVYEDSPACPVCGEYVTRSSSPLAGMPRWFAVLGVIGTLILVAMLAVGM